MKKLIPLFLMLICIHFLWAQNRDQINLSVTPGSIFYNYLNASNFDPEHPNLQPQLFTLNIQNNQHTEYSLRVELVWGSTQLFETFLKARSANVSSPSITVTNQNIFDSNGTSLFDSPDPSINLSQIMDDHPEFGDIILHTGRFPDGVYTFKIQAVTTDQNHLALSIEQPFILEISNANAIYLQSPGVQLGGMVPTLSNLPLTFLWNSNLAGIVTSSQIPGIGKFTLTIREFDQASDLQLDNIENGQIFRVIPEITQSMFSEYIPFNNGKYYAWQISTPLATSDVTNPAVIPSLKSPWFVFKFTTEAASGDSGNGGTDLGGTTGTGETGANGEGGNAPEDEIVIILTNLNNPQVSGLLNDGFRPTGNVWVGDQMYSGNSALQQLQGLAGKTIKSITLSDE